jgi:hypothetical protein
MIPQDNAYWDKALDNEIEKFAASHPETDVTAVLKFCELNKIPDLEEAFSKMEAL